MSTIFTLNKESAPFTHTVREHTPKFFFKYDVLNKPEGTKTAIHIVRSSLTISSHSLFIVAALVEKAIRSTIGLVKLGLDKALTKEQQQNLKNKMNDAATELRDAGYNFYHNHFVELFK